MPEFISARVVTLRTLFSGEFQFELPWFQRAYAWDAAEAGRLLTHVSEAALGAGRSPHYFLGTLVIAKEPGSAETALIDGQQRVLTLTILLAVLRDLEADPQGRADIHSFVAGDTLRFNPQEACAPFCREHVQAPGATDLAFDGDSADLTEAEHNILANRNHFREQLAERGFDAPTRRKLFAFLADNCFVVLHSFQDADEAWLWLQREEETQHRFNATDKAKNTLMLAMPAGDRETCSSIWDDCEGLLGAEDLFELLGHLRLIRRRKSSARPVESELAKIYDVKKHGTAFIQGQLLPAAKLVAALRARAVGGGPHRSSVSQSIDRACWIDDQVWLPAALHWLEARGEEGEIALYFKRLERLVWMIRLAGLDQPKKYDRMIALLADVDKPVNVAAMKSLDIERPLRDAVRRALQSETADRKHFIRPVLRLASIALDRDPGPFESCRATIEHILPQGRKNKSDWDGDFPPKSAPKFAHRLGNLTLLSLEENHAVANKGWTEKRSVYAKSDFVLSSELVSIDRWTPAAVTQRTQQLFDHLFSYWDLVE